MGGSGSGRPPGVKGIIRNEVQKQNPLIPSGDPMFLPNYSGTSDNLSRIGMKSKKIVRVADPVEEQDAAPPPFLP